MFFFFGFSTDVVQRLISKDKQILAVKFIFEFELTDEFPPVPLLKAHVMDSKRSAQKIRRSGKNSRQSLVIFSYLSSFPL